MKKVLLLSLIVLLTACGNESSSEANEMKKEVVTDVEASEPKEVVETASEHPYPTNDEEIGNATLTINTPSGDTTNGNVPVLFVSKDDSMIQIGADYEEFDGSVETFIYINEVFLTTEQAGELYQSVLSLMEKNLEPGEYTVTAVQFEGNDPTKEPINLTKAKFKIEKAS